MHHLFFFLAVFASPVSFAAGVAKQVVLISIDGGKARTVEKADVPEIKKLVKEGASSFKAQTIPNTITLPSHASMVSGVDMEDHGITWNIFKAGSPIISVPTIFSLAKKAGIKTALFTTKDKFKHLNAPGSIDQFALQDAAMPAEKLAKAAADYLKKEKPGMLMVHFADTDTTGHNIGWDTPQFTATLKKVDKAIAQLRKAVKDAGLEKTTLVILTADHGGTEKNHGKDIPEHREIPWIAVGPSVKKGHALTDKIATTDTAATILWALGVDFPSSWDGKVVKEAFVSAP